MREKRPLWQISARSDAVETPIARRRPLCTRNERERLAPMRCHASLHCYDDPKCRGCHEQSESGMVSVQIIAGGHISRLASASSAQQRWFDEWALRSPIDTTYIS